MKVPRIVQNNLPLALLVGAVAGLWCAVKAFKENRKETR